MINKVSFTVKGDYQAMTLCRDNGSRFVEMQYSYGNGCNYARFELADLKKAVELLEEQDDDKPIEKIPPKVKNKSSVYRTEMYEDIRTIIRERIEFAEVGDYGYKDSYMRDALRKAIRAACYAHNNGRYPIGGAPKLAWHTDFAISSHKDEDGKVHWYVRYTPPKEVE